MQKVKYIFTISTTAFAIWLGIMLWFHFPQWGLAGLIVGVPGLFTGIILLIGDNY